MFRVVEDLCSHLSRLEECIGVTAAPPIAHPQVLGEVRVEEGTADPVLTLLQDVHFTCVEPFTGVG